MNMYMHMYEQVNKYVCICIYTHIMVIETKFLHSHRDEDALAQAGSRTSTPRARPRERSPRRGARTGGTLCGVWYIRCMYVYIYTYMWYMAYGMWYMVYIWYTVYMVYGVWCLVYSLLKGYPELMWSSFGVRGVWLGYC